MRIACYKINIKLMVLRWIGDTLAGQNHARDIEVTRTVSQADFFVDAKTRELHADCRKDFDQKRVPNYRKILR